MQYIVGLWQIKVFFSTVHCWNVGLWQIKVFWEWQQCFSQNILFNVQFPIQMYYLFEHYFNILTFEHLILVKCRFKHNFRIQNLKYTCMWRVLNTRNFRKSIQQCSRYMFVTIKYFFYNVVELLTWSCVLVLQLNIDWHKNSQVIRPLIK